MQFILFQKEHFKFIHSNGWWSGIDHDGDNYYCFGNKVKIKITTKSFSFLNITSNIEKELEFRFELFGYGEVPNTNVVFCLFKPWLIDNLSPNSIKDVESFIYIVPLKILKVLLKLSIFHNHIDANNIGFLRVLNTGIILQSFLNKFSIDKGKDSWVSKDIKFQKLDFETINGQYHQNLITDFYKKHFVEISHIPSYFNHSLNTWFIILDSNNNMLACARLYEDKHTFTDGFNIEYVVHTNYRNKGLGTRIAKNLVGYVKQYTFALSIRGIIEVDNKASQKVLTNNDFMLISNDLISGNGYITYKIGFLEDYLNWFSDRFNTNKNLIELFVDKRFNRYLA